MILRSLEFSHFGCFANRSFEFRRGLNLVYGPNESGKTTLAIAISAILFGLPAEARRVASQPEGTQALLVLENGQRIVRIARDLKSDEVRLEERNALHQAGDSFQGRVPLTGGDPEVRTEYQEHLRRFFNLPDGPFPTEDLRLLLGACDLNDLARIQPLLGPPPVAVPSPAPPVPQAAEESVKTPEDQAQALEQDRQDYAEGVRYLEWARRQWQDLEANTPELARSDGQIAELEARREQLRQDYARTGLPDPLPEELPVLLAEAAEIRQELVTVGGETARLRDALLKIPGAPWRPALLLSLAAAAGAAAWAWLVPAQWWFGLLPAAALALLLWLWVAIKASAGRASRARLQGQGGVLEERRATAQERQATLDERFERLGLSPSAVAVARMQKNLEHGRQLLAERGEVEGALKALAGKGPVRPANLLPKAELETAEKTLEELAARILQREQQMVHGPAGTDQEAGDANPKEPTGEGKNDGWLPLFSEAAGDDCGRLLLALTDGRHDRLGLDPKRGCLLLGSAGDRQALDTCGQGTRAAVLLVVRLFLLRRLQTTGGLPLVLDEPLAGLDKHRQQEALGYLERLAAQHQIVLCSLDETLLKRAARDRWQVVSLEDGPAPTPSREERSDDVGQLHLL